MIHELNEGINTSLNSKYQLKNGILYYCDRLVIPKNNELFKEILMAEHDAKLSGHFGFMKTYSNIQRKYYWRNMKTYITKYIKCCSICQKNKSSNENKYGNLYPHDIPENKWDVISIDFITNLPITKGKRYNSIFVIVDKLTKMAHFIPHYITDNAPKIAELFVDNVFKYHGLPKKIISDRDTRFTSKFWKELMKLLDIKVNMSTAYHPQTNGQVERINRILEDYIRRYCNGNSDDWDKLLPLAEFAYNNSVSATTSFTPFYLNYGLDPRKDLNELYKESPNETAKEFANRMNILLTQAKDEIAKSVDNMEKYYNLHRKNTEFKVGDLVLLSTKNIKYRNQKNKIISKKFKPKYIGPFKVIEKISTLAYKLDLPNELKIHPVFNIMALKKYSGEIKENETNYNEIISEEDKILNKIIGKKILNNEVYYLVTYKENEMYEDTWVNESQLENHKHLIKDYENADFWVEISPKRGEGVITLNKH